MCLFENSIKCTLIIYISENVKNAYLFRYFSKWHVTRDAKVTRGVRSVDTQGGK